MQIAQNESFGFFRPYASDKGGVSPERWHLSYWPISKSYFENYTIELFKKNIEESSIELKEIVLENLPIIYQRYISNVDSPLF
jgi:hypothetical protein